MRLAVCAFSAVLLSGCSWLGMGGKSSHHGAGGAYAGCVPTACADGSYGYNGYGQAYGQSGAAYGAATGYGAGVQQAGYGQGVAGAGYGAGGLNGYGASGYGASGYAAGTGGPAGVGYQGAYGVPGQVGVVGGTQSGMGAFGNGTVTTLGANAPYGASAAYGQSVGGGVYSGQSVGGGVYGQNVVGSQYAGGQYVAGQAVRTVQGAPIYVPQPYGVPVGVGVGGGVAAAALPFGLSLLGGTDFDIDGDIYTSGKTGLAKNGDGTDNAGINIGISDGISYDDAFGTAKRVGAALERDLNRSTTVLGQFAYSNADGNLVENYETITDGTVDGGGNLVERGLDAGFSDLNTYTAELGLRKYVGQNPVFRPYVGATGGVVYNEGVDVARTYSDGSAYDPEAFEFIESGWNPTASGLLGAEMAVGHRGSIGVESGVRWTKGFDTALGDADDRISVPVTLRGRVAF